MQKLTIRLIFGAIGITMLSFSSAFSDEKSLNIRLLEAVRINDLDGVRQFIGQGASPFATHLNGIEAVEYAIDRGFFKVAHYLQAVQNQRIKNGQPFDKQSNLKAGAAGSGGGSIDAERPEGLLPTLHVDVQERQNFQGKNGNKEIKNRQEKIFRLSPRKRIGKKNIRVFHSFQKKDQTSLIKSANKVQSSKVVQSKLPQQSTIIDTSEIIDVDFKSAKIVALPDVSNASGKQENGPVLNTKKYPNDQKLKNSDSSSSKSFVGRLARLLSSKNTSKRTNASRKAERTGIKDVNRIPKEIFSIINDINESPAISKPENDQIKFLKGSASKTKKKRGMVSKLHRNNKLGNNIELDTSFGNDSSMSVEILDTRTEVAFANQTPSLNKLDYKLFNEFSLNPRQPRSTSEVIIDDWEVKQGIFTAVNTANIEPERFFKSAPKSIPKPNNAEKTGVIKKIELESLRSFMEKTPAVADITERRFKKYPITKNTIKSVRNQVPQIANPINVSVLKSKEGSIKNALRDSYNLQSLPVKKTFSEAASSSREVIESEVANLIQLEPLKRLPSVKSFKQEVQSIQRKLRSDELVVGINYKLGRKLSEKKRSTGGCVDKKGAKFLFCIEMLKWPSEISSAFGVGSFFSGGGRAIVQYNLGVATQYHVLFPASSFSLISKYLESLLGSPSTQPKIWTPVLGKEPRLNKTLQWVAESDQSMRESVLEIRQIDDLRWSGVPQMQYGVIRLYYSGEKSIFHSLTTTDLMMMQIRNKGKS